MTKTWNEIYSAAVEAGFYQIVMAAHENACETIYAEKAADASEFDRVALSSLEGLLSYSNDTAEQGFFAALGVRW